MNSRSREWLWVIVVCASVGNLVATASFAVLGPLVAKRYLGGASAYGAIVAAQSAGFIAGGLLSLRWRPARPLFVSVLALLPTAGEIACYAGVRVTGVIGDGRVLRGNWARGLRRQLDHRAAAAHPQTRSLTRQLVRRPRLLRLHPARARDCRPARGQVRRHENALGFLAIGLASIGAALLSRDVRTLRRVDGAGYTEAEARATAAS